MATINDYEPDEIVLVSEDGVQDGPCPECGVEHGDCDGVKAKITSSNGAHIHPPRHKDWEGN